jgi:carboxylesterase
VDPGPFQAGDGEHGILLIHGFTGSVAEVRELGQHLAGRGYRVRAPLLPGHGTHVGDLDAIRHGQWTQAVEDAFERLAGETKRQSVAGLSLGSLLALQLASSRPQIRAVACLSVPLKLKTRLLPLTLLLRHVIKRPPFFDFEDADLADPTALDRVWSYDQTSIWGAGEVYLLTRRVRRQLHAVRQPILVVQARGDGVVHGKSPHILNRFARNTDTTIHWLEKSGHNLLVDAERHAAFDHIALFLEAHHDRNAR